VPFSEKEEGGQQTEQPDKNVQGKKVYCKFAKVGNGLKGRNDAGNVAPERGRLRCRTLESDRRSALRVPQASDKKKEMVGRGDISQKTNWAGRLEEAKVRGGL
jgi:hypothetical protein